MIGLKHITFTAVLMGMSFFALTQTAYGQLFEAPQSTFKYPEPVFNEGMKRTPPYMPAMALQSGHCKFTLKLNSQAKIEKIDVYFCTDYIFEPASLDSIKNWEFEPELANQTLDQIMTFKLTDEKGTLLPEADIAAFEKHDIPPNGKDAKIKRVFPPPNLGWENLGDEVGHCCASFSVSQIGTPFNLEIDSCSEPGLELTAQDVVRNWEYRPGKLNGKKVSVGGHQGVVKFKKIDKRGNILRDVNGLTPIAGVSETALDYCRKLS